MKKTFWQHLTDDAVEFPTLKSNLDVDTVVVGGGIAGLLCALELQKRGQKVAILEAAQIGQGQTANSSAFCTFAHDIVFQRLLKKHGVSVAAEYLQLNTLGLANLQKVCEEISCPTTNCKMVLFATTKRGAIALTREHQVYTLLNQKTQLTTETQLPFAVTLALSVDNQFCLNPFEFTTKLAKHLKKNGVQIFENTRVKSPPEGNVLNVNSVCVTAKNFVVATHFPIFNTVGFYFSKMYQSRSHNVVFRGNLTDMYESAEGNGFEFRPTKSGILCGGASVRTGKQKHKSRFDVVKKHISKTFGEREIVAEFSAQDAMTFDLLPFVGRYSTLVDNLFVISGFNKWGFSTAAISAKLIADTMENPNTENIFSPERSAFLKAPLKTLKNTATQAFEFLNLPFSFDAKKFERVKNNQGAVVKHKGKRIGVYRDQTGKIFAINAVCTHLGCGLKWNKDELSWDCPCHGSRFDIYGNVLSSPAVEHCEKVKFD